MRRAISWMLVLAGAGFTGVAKADNWNFFFPSGPNSNVSLGNSFTFSSTGGVNITAYGFLDSGTAAPIFDKYTAPGYQNGQSEDGVGLKNESDHEIDTSGYVELNLSNIVNGTILTLSLGSVQTPESYNVYDTTGIGALSNQPGGKGPESGAGNPFTPLVMTNGQTAVNQVLNQVTNQAFITFTKTASFQYIAIEETAGNTGDISVGTLSSTTPEPGYYVLLFAAMAGLAAVAIRRERARQVRTSAT